MTSFATLFREGQKTNPLDHGELARSRARELLLGTGIVFWDDSSPIPIQNGTTIGIAFYSLPELELLDRLILIRDSVADSNGKSIIVFDVLRFKTMADFERLIPSFGPAYQTPIVGIWQDGNLVEKGTGGRGRALLSRYYNLNE